MASVQEGTKESIKNEREVDADSDAEETSIDHFFESPNFYKNAQNYWSRIPATVDGMLGGLGFIDSTDIKASQEFLNELFKIKPQPARKRALDCGAGIGRVTKNLLIKNFSIVDLVEQDSSFANEAKESLSAYSNVGTVFNVGLQDFSPESGAYDVIWTQWVLGHLTDADLLDFFKRCSSGLSENGCIIIKENFTATDDFCIDATDSSVTRSLAILKNTLDNAGLRIIKIKKQENFVQGLFPVSMLACRPCKNMLKTKST